MDTMLQTAKTPFLLYSYPWMPFPRVVGIYLKERHLSPSLVKVVQVADPQNGDCVVEDQKDTVPPRPQGSLPILVIQTTDDETAFASSSEQPSTVYIRQSPAIINFLEEACQTSSFGFPQSLSSRSMLGNSLLERARIQAIRTLAEECLVAWNPVRSFASGAGSMKLPVAAKEMIPWALRPLVAANNLFEEEDNKRHLEEIDGDEKSYVTVADIVLYQFLEFVNYCYGVDIISVEVEATLHRDAYGRNVKQGFSNLRAFYGKMKMRPSVQRDTAGELPSEKVLTMMRTWYDGVWPAAGATSSSA